MKEIVQVQKQLTKIGQQKPYFSITATIWEPHVGRKFEGGDYKQFDGKWYIMTGAGCQHEEILKRWPEYAPLVALHLSNEDGVPMHAVANGFYYYKVGEYKVLAKHLRISMEEVAALCAKLDAYEDMEDRRTIFGNYVMEQHPRWKQEAEDAIKKFDLQIGR